MSVPPCGCSSVLTSGHELTSAHLGDKKCGSSHLPSQGDLSRKIDISRKHLLLGGLPLKTICHLRSCYSDDYPHNCPFVRTVRPYVHPSIDKLVMVMTPIPFIRKYYISHFCYISRRNVCNQKCYEISSEM